MIEVADKDLKFTTAEEYINNALDYDSGAEDGSEEEKTEKEKGTTGSPSLLHILPER
jgi:hypothetical protein|tara:strand:- start:1181 stop:1351 length:171 start_codon:yes stop_codon:yes gene_type:complete